jgi:hypothetical protein
MIMIIGELIVVKNVYITLQLCLNQIYHIYQLLHY